MTPFEIHDDPRQPHRELGKEIMIADGKSELQPAPKNGVFHKIVSEIRTAFPGFRISVWLPPKSADGQVNDFVSFAIKNGLDQVEAESLGLLEFDFRRHGQLLPVD